MTGAAPGLESVLDRLLPELEPRTWSAGDGMPSTVRPRAVFVQPVDNGLEVAVATARGRPTSADMRRAWKARQRGRACPVLLMVAYEHGDEVVTALCGPSGEEPPIHTDVELPRVERLAATALAEPTRHAAQRCLLRLLPEVDTDLPGLVNSGLLATHELRDGVPQRADWAAARRRGRAALGLRGRQLIERLGYSIETLSTNTSLLKAGDERRAVAVFLDEGETFDGPAGRFDGVSPVSHALAIADREQLAWVVLTRSSEIRLYTARPDVGVGRKGRAETFVEANLALLPEDAAGYLQLLFSAEALARGGSVEQILSSSADFAADLAARLRDRVYKEAVPALARAIADRLSGPIDDAALASAYEQTLTVLFRLLFVAYGEDKDLLPYDTNSRYAEHSLKRMARGLADAMNSSKLVFDPTATDLWEDVTQLWRAVERGNRGWGVPPYDGGLFAADNEHPVGAALARLALTDAELGPAMTALLVDTTPDGVVGPVDFRSLSVREFGTIYEGLLESELSVAPSDLAVDKDGNYVLARRGAAVEVPAGAVYLHNRSGARKATGSYFTKPFAVEHLLDHALEPALVDHLRRVQELFDAGDEARAASAFFDFRCADIAMGSGHFLVAAVDRIEARLSAFLALTPIPHVVAELDSLRAAAFDALGDLADGVEIETTSLLRRQVARRCIYGVDRNRIAVELARLAIWIHTFVPGLPLSFLDHNLVQGDSLLGVATIDEALGAIGADDPRTGTISLARDELTSFLERASTALRRLGTIADATVAEVHAAHDAHLEAQAAVEPARALFDLVVANRLAKTPLPLTVDEKAVLRLAANTDAYDLIAELEPLHFPVAFPEVFLRDRPGFDCILGNPPWEEVKAEERDFWTLRFPGLRSLTQGDQSREIARLRKTRPNQARDFLDSADKIGALGRLLLAGPYPGMETGDPDLYKAFSWRFWQLSRDGGAIGVVLPRSALSAKGSSEWRLAVLGSGAFADVTLLLNNMKWVFEDVHPQYTFALASIRKGVAFAGEIALRGPFPSLARFRAGVTRSPARFTVAEFRSWSEGASFPLLPSPEAIGVFQKLRHGVRIDAIGWRPVREFDATNDKKYFVFSEESPRNAWPVFKGESFNIWLPDTGAYYAWADPDQVLAVLQRKRLRQQKLARSAFSGFPSSWAADPNTLPCLRARIAFRGITNRTNQRTVISALVPPQIVISNSAPYLLSPHGDERDEAYLLGVLASMPLDWYARRVVEVNLNFYLFNAFPIPDPTRDAPVRRRVEEIAGRLAAADARFTSWADAVGVPVASVTDDEKPELLAELDAAVALLYGLDEQDLHVIYSTFHEGADYSAHERRVIEHFRKLS